MTNTLSALKAVNTSGGHFYLIEKDVFLAKNIIFVIRF